MFLSNSLVHYQVKILLNIIPQSSVFVKDIVGIYIFSYLLLGRFLAFFLGFEWEFNRHINLYNNGFFNLTAL